MFTQKALRLGMVVMGCAVLVFVLGGCASCARCSGGGKATSDRIPQATNQDLTKGYSLSEYQLLNARDQKVYEAERHNDIYPEHKGTNGTYLKTSAEEGKIWHWGI